MDSTEIQFNNNNKNNFLLGKKKLRSKNDNLPFIENPKQSLHLQMDLDDYLNMGFLNNENAQENIISENLDIKTVKENKQMLSELTNVRINYEPEANNFILSINSNLNNNDMKIKQLFSNHVIK